MNNLLFVTVGTSAIHNELLGTLDGRDNQALRDAALRYLDDPDKPTEDMGRYGSLFGDLCHANLEFWRNDFETVRKWIQERRYFRATSAELLSTYILRRESKLEFKRVVLLASDTPDGLMAARINQSVMHSSEFQEKVQWSLTSVDCKTVPGLDKGLGSWFEEIPKVVAEAGRDQERYRVNITGGYKGIALAFGYLAREESKPPYSLYYLHESLSEPMFINASGPLKGPAKSKF